MQKDCMKQEVTYNIGLSYVRKSAFTLAEMMVVMLILTIVLAAFAPMMTKRKTIDITSPWRYATNNSDAYFGLAAQQTALLGKNSKSSDDISSKLLINTLNNSQAHISFLSSGTRVGQLYMNGSNLLLGGSPSKISYSGSGNTGTGKESFGAANLTGSYNTGIGYRSLYNVSTGSNNTATGYNSLYTLTSASGNTAHGYYSLYKNTVGSSNTAVGSYSGYSNEYGAYNTALGSYALYSNKSGYFNTATGYESMKANTSGYYNTANGYRALYNNSEGDRNTALGYNACVNVTGSNKTCIGADSGPTNGSAAGSNSDNVVYLGTSNSTVYIPGRLLVEGEFNVSNMFHVGTRDSKEIYINIYNRPGPTVIDFKQNEREVIEGGGGYWQGGRTIPDVRSHYSDKRLKNIKGVDKAGLEEIRKLKVYDYTYKNDPEKEPHVGVIAQELQEVFPDSVSENLGGYLMVRQEEMFYAMVNAIKELDAIVQNFVEEIKTAFSRLDKHDEEIKALQEKVKSLQDENEILQKHNQDLEKRLERLEKLF